MAHYSIGEFAEKTGLSIPTLRYYEQEKLIYSHREENNRRYYDDSDIAWTQFIIRLKKTGMSIKNMQEYADLRYKGDSTIPQRLRLLFFQLDELHKQQTEINQHIDFLEKKIKTYLGINPNFLYPKKGLKFYFQSLFIMLFTLIFLKINTNQQK